MALRSSLFVRITRMFPSFHFSRENSVTLVSSYDVNKVFDEGMNQLMLANFEEALIAFSSCIEHHNEKTAPIECYYNRALCYHAVKNCSGALEDLAIVLSHAPHHVQALLKRIEIHSQLNQTKLIVIDLRILIQFNLIPSETATSLYNKALDPYRGWPSDMPFAKSQIDRFINPVFMHASKCTNVVVVHLKYVGEDDVEVSFDAINGVVNLLIRKGFPNGVEPFADVQCPEGKNLGGPMNPNGGLLFQYHSTDVHHFSLPTIVRTTQSGGTVRRLDIGFPCEFEIYSYDDTLKTIKCLTCSRSFRSDVLLKHFVICEKVFYTRRQAYSTNKTSQASHSQSTNIRGSLKINSTSDSSKRFLLKESMLQVSYLKHFGDYSPRFGVAKVAKKTDAVVESSESHSTLPSRVNFRGGPVKDIQKIEIIEYLKEFSVNPGKLSNVIERVKRKWTVVLFLSSPFDGCEEERAIFMNTHLTSLSAICLRKGVTLTVVDMRWGITEAMAKSGKTILACLSAIDNAEIFIGFFGARYGSSKLVERNKVWIDEAVDKCIRGSAETFSYLEAYRDRSITEMEWQHAFLHSDFSTNPLKPVCIFGYRDSSFDKLKALQCPDLAKNFTIENESSAKAALALRQHVLAVKGDSKQDRCGPYSRLDCYSSVFENYRDPEQFASLISQCCEYLLVDILKALTGSQGSGARIAHLCFARGKLASFIDSGGQVSFLKAFIHSNDTKPLVVQGGGGAGKSCILACCVEQYASADETWLQAENKNESRVFPIFHFAGCNSNSALLQEMLHRIYEEFVAFVESYNLSSICPRLDSLELNDILPQIASICKSLGNRLPRVVIFIDALNELYDDAYNDAVDITSSLVWLPLVFPSTLKIIISCIIGGLTHETLSIRDNKVINVDELSEAQRKKIVYAWHESNFKTVEETVMHLVWESNLCSNPMYLSFVMKQLILHGSFQNLKGDCIQLLSTTSIISLLKYIFERIEESTMHLLGPPNIIQSVMKYVYCSSEGLRANELITLINQDLRVARVSDALLDSGVWQSIAYSINHLLLIRQGLYCFAHDYVRQAVEQLYFDRTDEDEIGFQERKRKIHSRLVIFFKASSSVEDSTIARPGEYPRSMRELTFQQRRAGVRPSIVVAVRVRPLNANELSREEVSCVRKLGKEIMLYEPNSKDPHIFSLDFVFDSSESSLINCASQDDVFKLCGVDVIEQTLEGYNVSVFAYGQTGSGKSYTMFGTAESPGLVPRTLRELFRQMEIRRKQRRYSSSMECTLVEIYLDEVYDLLNDRTKLDVRCLKSKVVSEAQSNKTGIKDVCLPGAVKRDVLSMSDIDAVLEIGNNLRITKGTDMNQESSRSHCILSLRVLQTHLASGKIGESKINLVDLAGSERISKSNPSDDQTLKESIATNRSLAVLNSCINALSTKKSTYVPYRESTLTWILQDTLGGNSKTVFLATVSPAPSSFYESLCSLQYAKRAKNMPNSISSAINAEELRKEAIRMLHEETQAKKICCNTFGLHASHLDLLKDFIHSKRDIVFFNDVSDTTWVNQKELWEGKLKDCSESQRRVTWIKSFSAKCTNASTQRCLRVLPGETIEFTILFTFFNLMNSWIEQLYIAIDIFHPVARVAEICHSAKNDEVFVAQMKVPMNEGLYMLWYRNDMMYSMDDAEKNLPSSYDSCNDWYHGFICWIRVDKNAVAAAPGPPAKFM